MADVVNSVFAFPWEEDECLEYYGMLSLHQLFDVIGSQLTESDVDALSFLLNESYPFTHPLDPSIWTVEEADEMPSNALLSAWNKWNRCSKPSNDLEFADILRPKNGIELLYELERRGYCAEGNFRHLFQLLRVLTRHDLLPYVSFRRRRPVSPERYTYGPSVMDSRKQVDECLNPTTSQSSEENWETGSTAKKRKRTGNVRRGRCQKPKKTKVSSAPEQAEPTQNKVTCGIRLRVRAEYCQHESILSQNVLSVKQDPLERRFDLFSQSNTVLKSRDLGSIICDIKFSELAYLDAFWNDYMNGSLLEALKGVFITDSLKEAVGQETIQLLVNVDEDDYEEGRRLLLENFP